MQSASERQEAAKFRSEGYSVEFSEEKGEGHVMRTLDGNGAPAPLQAV